MCVCVCVCVRVCHAQAMTDEIVGVYPGTVGSGESLGKVGQAKRDHIVHAINKAKQYL